MRLGYNASDGRDEGLMTARLGMILDSVADIANRWAAFEEWGPKTERSVGARKGAACSAGGKGA